MIHFIIEITLDIKIVIKKWVFLALIDIGVLLRIQVIIPTDGLSILIMAMTRALVVVVD